MRVRVFTCGLLFLAMLMALPARAQAQGAQTSDDRRPALPTFFGDTGLWFVPTAETLPSRGFSVSAYRANFDRSQGLTDVGYLGLTAAFGVTDRLEVFGSWRVVRFDRDVRPTFVPSDLEFGGVSYEYPFVAQGWSATYGAPLVIGGKFSAISQSRGDAMSLAPRLMLKLPTGPSRSSTDEMQLHLDLVASREVRERVEVTGAAGALIRRNPEQFRLSDGIVLGVGAAFPSRSPLRALVEWQGEFEVNDTVRTLVPFVAADGSAAPAISLTTDPSDFKVGAVWQDSRGWFVHGGLNYSVGTGDRPVGGRDIGHGAWGFDLRIGLHPGVKRYVPPPPPPPEIREVIREVPAPAPPPPPPPPPPNRNPGFTLNATCDPGILPTGQTSRCSATATDADGDPVSYRWTAPSGTFSAPAGQNTNWTASNQPGNVPVMVTAQDNRGGSATSTMMLQVIRREEVVLEDVHFDNDRATLTPDARKILDEAVAKLQANPGVRVTIEGHTDSAGAAAYNQRLAEQRANQVRDYLVGRGIANMRLTAVSFGEDRPIASNTTRDGRAMNRRVHFVVIMEP